MNKQKQTQKTKSPRKQAEIEKAVPEQTLTIPGNKVIDLEIAKYFQHETKIGVISPRYSQVEGIEKRATKILDPAARKN